jgi:hypothetical protein
MHQQWSADQGLTWSGGSNLARAKCPIAWSDASRLASFVLLFFSNLIEYNNYTATVLAGRDQVANPPKIHYPEFNFQDEPTQLVGGVGRLQYGTCVAHEEGGTWYTQRLGAFRSTGGDDWWRMSWLMENLAGKETMGFGAHVFGVFDDNNKLLPNPPIHMHHIHVNPVSNDVYSISQERWWNLRLLEHHGDWQFLDSMDSIGQDYHGQVKWLQGELPSVNAECNDLRPAGSPPLSWFVQLSVLLVSPEQATGRALSVQKTHNPFPVPTCAMNFGCSVATFFHDTRVDSWLYYEGSFHHAGTLVGAVLHSHQPTHQRSLIYGGLHFEELRHFGKQAHSSVPIVTTSTGFADNRAFERHLVEVVFAGQPPICQANGSLVLIDGKVYDRAAEPECTPWQFQADEGYTSISFFGPTAFGVAQTPEVLPDHTFSNHLVWFFTYAARDDATHYAVEMNKPQLRNTFLRTATQFKSFAENGMDTSFMISFLWSWKIRPAIYPPVTADLPHDWGRWHDALLLTALLTALLAPLLCCCGCCVWLCCKLCRPRHSSKTTSDAKVAMV